MAKYTLTLAAITAVLSFVSSSASEPLKSRNKGPNNNNWRGYGSDPESSYSIPTAATAAPTASGVGIARGSEYLDLSTVTGYFLQDVNTTNPSTFSYVSNYQ